MTFSSIMADGDECAVIVCADGVEINVIDLSDEDALLPVSYRLDLPNAELSELVARSLPSGVTEDRLTSLGFRRLDGLD